MTSEPNPFAAPRAFEPEPLLTDSIKPAGPVGFGGWLILPMIGMVLTPIAVIFAMILGISSFFNGAANYLSTPTNTAYHPMWIPSIVMEITSNFFILLSVILLWIHWIKKTEYAPKIAIFVLATQLIVLIIDTVLLNIIANSIHSSHVANVQAQASGQMMQVGRSFISAAIWIAYFLRSERVANTFQREVAGLFRPFDPPPQAEEGLTTQ